MRRPATSSSVGLVFVDTNVLIYARDERASDKPERARVWMRNLVAREGVRVNLQVLNELARWIFRREAMRPVDDVREEIASLRVWGDKALADDELEMAWIVRDRLGYQWFDCLLLAAAHLQGCRYFLTEDMAHGATFEGTTLINPFRMTPDELFQRN